MTCKHKSAATVSVKMPHECDMRTMSWSSVLMESKCALGMPDYSVRREKALVHSGR